MQDQVERGPGLEVDEVLADRFQVYEVLDSAGDVVRVRAFDHETDCVVLMEWLGPCQRQDVPPLVQRAVSSLNGWPSPRVPRVREVILDTDPARPGLWLVLDDLAGQSLASAAVREGGLPERVLQRVSEELLLLLKDLERSGRGCHGDLNPWNIWLVGPSLASCRVVALGWLGPRKAATGKRARELLRLDFAATEVQLGEPGPRSDTYSVGASLLFAVSGGMVSEIPQRHRVWWLTEQAGLPPWLAEFVERACSTTSDGRFEDLDEAIEYLSGTTHALSGGHTPIPSTTRGRDWRLTPTESRQGLIGAACVVMALAVALPALVLALQILPGWEDLPLARRLVGLGAFFLALVQAGLASWELSRPTRRVLSVDDTWLYVELGKKHTRTRLTDLEACSRWGPLLLVRARWRSDIGEFQRNGLLALAPVYNISLAEVEQRLRERRPHLRMATQSLGEVARSTVHVGDGGTLRSAMAFAVGLLLVPLTMGGSAEAEPRDQAPIAAEAPRDSSPPLALADETLPPSQRCPHNTRWRGEGSAPPACFDDHGGVVPNEGVDGPAWIDQLEVTVGAYGRCAYLRGCTSAGKEPGCTSGLGDERLPVNCVTREQASDYCRWTGRRLCSRAEWKRALGWADHPWGDAAPSCFVASIPDQVGPGCGLDRPDTVGARPEGASPEGALDLIGNVAEWARTGAALGGSWSDGTGEPDSPGPDVGFRCCR